MVEDAFEDDEASDGVNATGIYSIKMRLSRNIPQMVPLDGRRIKLYYRNIQKQCTKCFGPHLGRNCANEKVAWIDYVGEFIRTNPHLDRDLFGKWLEITERIDKQKEADKAHYESKQPRPEEEPQNQGDPGNPEKDGPQPGIISTKPSLSAEPETTAQNQTQETQETTEQDITPEPKPSEFNLPETDEEINKIIAKLIEFGMSNSDAVANIEKRKKLFNQALKKHMSVATRAAKKNRPLKNRKDSLNDK